MPGVHHTGVLYVVATPIGNLEDITMRAVRILKEADLIAAEDTRHTRKLLNHLGLKTPATSYHDFNEKGKARKLLSDLKGGKSLALVTDAGTPGISDPGYRLVKAAAAEGVEVVAVPGPSALVAALSISGLPTDEFTFKGFVPSGAAERRKFFTSLKGAGTTVVLYESARRLAATLKCIVDVMGDAEVAVAKEMTKVHEEVIRGTAGEVMEAFKFKTLKGEVTVVLSVPGAEADRAGAAEEIKRLIGGGATVRDAAAIVSDAYGITKKEAYKAALVLKGRRQRS